MLRFIKRWLVLRRLRKFCRKEAMRRRRIMDFGSHQERLALAEEMRRQYENFPP